MNDFTMLNLQKIGNMNHFSHKNPISQKFPWTFKKSYQKYLNHDILGHAPFTNHLLELSYHKLIAWKSENRNFGNRDAI